MGFLARVEAASSFPKGDVVVSLEDVYKGDPQYLKLVDAVAELIRRLAMKFQIRDKILLDFFIQHLKEEL